MQHWIPIVISAIALLISGGTAWLTLFQRGKLQMTQPTTIFIGPDESPTEAGPPHIKVYLRTLLFSTSRTGQIVESIYVSLHRGETKQNFSVWVYGEDKLARGSGLFVGREGVACNHHFLLPKDGTAFPLLAGKYALRVFAKRLCDRTPHQLIETHLVITDHEANRLTNGDAGIYFDWGPDQNAYQSHVEIRSAPEPPEWLLKMMGHQA